MSAFIGLCLDDGAFLSADSRRVNTSTGQILRNDVKKIHSLTDKIVIATGGLGTIGHEAREELTNNIQKHDTISDIIPLAQKIFSTHFNDSFKKGNTNTPLYGIFAGQNENGRGFICAISSKDDFSPVWITKPGQPFFSGSSTKLVIKISSENYHRLKNTGDIEYNIANWSILSFDGIVKFDKNVGFPVQLVLQNQNFVESTVHSLNQIKQDDRFKYRFIY